jgi:hypothetical protein
MESSETKKVAAITDDGTNFSHHFGRSRYYVVVTIMDGEIIGHEQREKLGHTHFANEIHLETPGQPHGMDAASHKKHIC